MEWGDKAKALVLFTATYHPHKEIQAWMGLVFNLKPEQPGFACENREILASSLQPALISVFSPDPDHISSLY